MQQTPLFGEYGPLGAKVVDFHGWPLPVQFSGILLEHQHTRTKAGLFDCSHMSEFLIEGADAIAAVDRLVCADLSGIRAGRCRYTLLLNERAGIVDDCVGIRLDAETLYLVTNAGPARQVAGLLHAAHASVKDLSGETAKLDVQGPASRDVLLDLGLVDAAPLKFWTGTRSTWKGEPIVIARAGYTGELGYELFVPPAVAVDLWRGLAGHPAVAPCGLGARDTLRTEMGFPLHGQDLSESVTPLEAHMDRFVAWDSDFVGKAALEAQRNAGGYDVLMSIRSAGRGAPRPGHGVKRDGETVGRVTSGTFGPSLGCGVGLACLHPECAIPGTQLSSGPRDMSIEAVESPVYKNATSRRKF